MKGILKIDSSENFVLLSIDTKLYSLDVIYTVSYVFLEKAYLFLEGEVENEILVTLTPKIKSNESSLNSLGREFLNELINYEFYKRQSEKNKEIRQILLQRALLTNLGEKIDSDEDLDDLEDLDYVLDDPEGIALPWEEKYGKGED